MAEPPSGQFKLIRSNKSQKERYKLIEGGFIYDRQRILGDTTHWQCEKRGICKARIHTNGNVIIKRTNIHLHLPNEEEIDCITTKSGLKRKARDTHDSTHGILGDVLETVNEGTTIKLPKLDSLKRTIRRERQSIDAAPAQPESLEHLIIPPEYQVTQKGDNFLLFDSGPGSQRIIMFGTQENVEMLNASQIWLADGTFKTAPPLFSQVYCIHGLRGGPNPLQDGHLLPCLFILLPSKTEAIYARMWERIHLLCPTAEPTHMLMDFEIGAINSFRVEWPLTNVKGCFFHLTQNFWRKIQEIGLQGQYMHDKDIALRLRMLPALAFASPFDVRELFPQVIEHINIPEATELALYFERTYVGRTLAGGHVNPIYPIEMWNHHHEVPIGIPRTTNSIEAWHRSYNATIGCHHPNIWKFIKALMREQGLVEVRQAKYIGGDKPSKRVKNRANEEALLNLVLGYLTRPPIEFLKGIAFRFSLD